MPFTFAHPAVIIPIYRKWKSFFSLTGLVVGSIVPDFEYFIRMSKTRLYTHNWFGLFWADLPLGIILAYLFHYIIKQQLLLHLPPVFKNKLLPYNSLNWNTYFKHYYGVVCISILLGGATHLLWDSLTHDNGMIAQLLNISGYRFNIANIRLHITSWLQLLSSAIGLWFIFWVILQLPNKYVVHVQSVRPIQYYWIKILMVAMAICFIRIYFFMSFYRPLSILVTVIASFLYSLIIVPIIFSNILSRKE
ncbi:DUF4184 family protein [Hydrotalea sp.]|uniref:DUF4184 family protein n=1 Tax=Hydrotalea sp. TaxID=2881279 RepID=UPI003D12B5F7